MMLEDAQIREELLAELSKDKIVIKALMDYTENKFIPGINSFEQQTVPMLDEPFVSSWRAYATAAKSEGLFATLKSRIVQFQFPVEQNISGTEAYRAATLKGKFLKNSCNFSLKEESSLTLHIHEGLAGGMPVLSVRNKTDFYSIVQALCFKNEPVALPQSMGAVMIQGLNNWDRLNAYRNNGYGLPDKSLYQDKIIILSRQGYSNKFGIDLGIEQKEWLNISSEIRLYHEYAHYFTLRYFGHMANNLHDELVADYAGINKVLGKFNASWFLHFMGLADYPNYKQGGRLENYIKKEQFSDQAFSVLCTLVYRASVNVERFDEMLGSCNGDLDRSIRLLCLCKVDLICLSGPGALSTLHAVYFDLAQPLI